MSTTPLPDSSVPPAAWGLRDAVRAEQNLRGLANALGPEAFGSLTEPLGRLLPGLADPDMALNNLERFAASGGLAAHLDDLLTSHGGGTLETLLALFSTSQYLSD